MYREEIKDNIARLVSGGVFASHHTAVHRGYVRVKDGSIKEYKGRFGQGYVVHYPSNWRVSSSHHEVEYLITAKL